MDWLAQIAPTIATALGGPLAGMAVSAVSKAMGVKPEEVQNIIQSGKMDSAQVAALQQAELELKKQAQQMGLDFAKLSNEDRASARNMQTSVKSFIPPLLSILVTIGFFAILTGLMMQKFQSSEALMIMLGSLGTAWTGIIAFYFGSSAGSQAKDELLHKSTPTP